MRLRIGHLDYDVSAMSVDEADEEGVDGLCQHHLQRIRVREELPPSQQAGVLLHEVLHALWNVYAIPRRGLTEEEVVARLEAPLLMLLRDNRHLVVALYAALDHDTKVVG